MTREFSTILEDYEGTGRTSEGVGFQIDIRRMLVLRAPLIVGVALVLALPAMLAGWFLTPVVYTARAQVRYVSTSPVVFDSETRTDDRTYNKFVSTEILQINGPEVISLVLEAFTQDNRLLLSSLADQPGPREYLENAISAKRQGDSELVTVTCTLPVREEAARVLDTLLGIYVIEARKLEKQEGPTEGTFLAALDTTEEELRTERTGKQTLLSALEEDLARYSVEPLERSVDEQQIKAAMLEVEMQVTELEAQQREVEGRIADLQSLRQSSEENPSLEVVDHAVAERLNQDQQVRSVREQELQSRLELATFEQTQPATSPQLSKARQRHSILAANVKSTEQEVLRQVVDAMLSESQEEKVRLGSRIEDLNRMLDEYTADLDKIQTAYNTAKASLIDEQALYAKKKSEIDAIREEMQAISDDIMDVREKRNAIKAQSRLPSRIIDPTRAIVPETQNYKKKIMYVLMGLFGAGGLGLGAGLLREITDQQLRSPRDFARVTQLPVVAAIPAAEEDPALDGGNHALLAAEHTGSRSADEFRRILSRILYPEENGAEANTLLVTSPSRGDGKTSVACNLAVALGHSNRRVLLVDLNAQRSDVEKTFGIERGPGLAELLDGLYDRAELIQASAYGNVSILGPGLRGAGLSSRLASREMVEFLEWADENFDHTIIDTPAFLLMSDAKLLAPTVDAVLVVVGAKVSNYGMVRRCLSDLEHLHANVIGIILNHARRLRGGYMRRNLELYYAYGDDNADGITVGELPEMEIIETPDELEDAVVLLPYGEDAEETKPKR